MKLFHRLLVLAFAMMAIMSCSNDFIYDINDTTQTPVDPVEEGTAELRFGVPATRATIDENLDLRWQRGDRITVMAYDGETKIFSKEASFWANLTSNSPAGSQGYFKAKFDTTAEADVVAAVEDMAAGKCYAVSPVKGVTIEGTTATMTIPAVQNGEYGNAPDFMTARSNSISQLKLCTGGTSGSGYKPEESNYINNIDLQFTHHTHAFRVSIPSNLMGKKIAKAYLKFPFAVVGDVTVDYTTGAVTEVNNTSDLVVVEFSQPRTAGDEFWVFINGVANKGQVDIRFQAEDGTYTERRLANFTQKNWVAGSVSKINVSIPQATTLTTIQCSVPNYSQLGEPVTNLHLKLADGFYFADYTTSSSTTINQSSSYIADNLFVLFSDMIDSSFRSAGHSLTFESQNALGPNPDPIVFGSNITVNQVNTYALTAPYLFFEDFSGISTFNYELNKNTGAVTAKSLDEYGMMGWYGARVGVSSGAVAVGIRHETVAQYRGRLDTSGLSTIKDGKSVNIQVKFNAIRSNKWVYIDCGVGLVGEGALGGDDGISVVSNRVDPTINTSATYTNIGTTDYAYTANGANNSHRLSWVVSRDYKYGNPWESKDKQNGWYSESWYVYMDNIRVTIVK